MSIETIEQTCTSCHGRLVHKGGGKLVCPFCDAEYFNEKLAKLEKKAKKEEEYEEEYDDGEELTDEEIADIVWECVEDYEDPEGYGVQIAFDDQKLSKEDKARDNFDIPEDETIFMIYDETMFGSCKKGYVITDRSLYIIDENGELYSFPWDEFWDAKIKRKDGSTDVKVNGVTMSVTGGDGAGCTYQMLCDIADSLEEA